MRTAILFIPFIFTLFTEPDICNYYCTFRLRVRHVAWKSSTQENERCSHVKIYFNTINKQILTRVSSSSDALSTILSSSTGTLPLFCRAWSAMHAQFHQENNAFHSKFIQNLGTLKFDVIGLSNGWKLF